MVAKSKPIVLSRGLPALLSLWLLAACGGSPAASPSGKPAPVQLTVGVGNIALTITPLLVGQKEGYFASEGIQLNLQVVNAGSNALVAGIAGGSLDLGVTGTDAAIIAMSKGQPLEIVGTDVVGVPADLVFSQKYASSKGITASSSNSAKIAALRGAKVGTPGSGTVFAVAKQFLASNGVDPDKSATLVPISNTDALPTALRNGTVDVIAAPPPQANVPIVGGYGVLGWNFAADPSLKGISWDSVVVKKDWIQSHKDALVRFLRAFWRADSFLQAHSQMAQSDVHSAYFSSLAADVFSSAWMASTETFPANPLVTQSQITGNIQHIVTPESPTKVNVTFAQVATNTYAQQSKP